MEALGALGKGELFRTVQSQKLSPVSGDRGAEFRGLAITDT